MPTTLSRAQRREQSQEAILDAAITLFSERGYTGVSLDEIAKRAGVKRPLLLYYYNSKDELWYTAAENVIQNFNEHLASQLKKVKGDTREERLRSALEVMLNTFLDEPNLARFLVQEGGVSGPRLRWLIQRYGHKYTVSTTYASEELRERLQNTVLRTALMAIYFSAAALGPFLEEALSFISGKPQAEVYPMSSKTRRELVSLLMTFLMSVDSKRN